MRTVRAVDFIERYVDANTLAMAVREKYHRVVEEQERVEDRLAELARLSTKKAQKEAEADAEAERRYYWYRR
jgi:FixJ family two-component response regulator